MPRGARLDTPGTLHHVMPRGIERGDIVNVDIRQPPSPRVVRTAPVGHAVDGRTRLVAGGDGQTTGRLNFGGVVDSQSE